MLIEGKNASHIFRHEPGGHRFQTVSPTDKKGRVHTSTVTAAVLQSQEKVYAINTNDVEYQITKGSGPGGQHRNKCETCVTAIHIPTGIKVRIDSRDQRKNKIVATKILEQRVVERAREADRYKRAANRKSQKGTGMRGDKVRTYRERDDQVIDHISGKKWKYSKWMKGQW